VRGEFAFVSFLAFPLRGKGQILLFEKGVRGARAISHIKKDASTQTMRTCFFMGKILVYRLF